MKLLLCLLLLAATNLRAGAVLEAFGELPADTRDQFGDTVGGIGSGLVYDAKNNDFLCIADRGPGDGKIPFRPRYVIVKIRQQGDRLIPTVVKSVLFRDEKGRAMTGLIPDDPTAKIPRMKDGHTCMDPEAIALAPDGTIYISEEYGPLLYQFRADGRLIRRITLPEEFRPRTAEGRLDFSDRAKLVSGRDINKGGEGMCLLAQGRQAAIIFEHDLVQHGGGRSPFTRLVVLDLATEKPVAIYLYPFAKTLIRHSINDLAALSDTKLLVLERDGLGRDGARIHKKAAQKTVWIADLSGATNLLTEKGPITPTPKKLLLNLPDLVPDASRLAAKWEGVAILPSIAKDHLNLMMSADNDFLTPIIHNDGQDYPFPRTQESVPTQFAKIRATLP